jgi:hypothetical protein
MHGEREQRGVRCIAERSDHPREVLERRGLGAALFEAARRLALEVQDDEVFLGTKDLTEVVVAVDANLLARVIQRPDRIEAGQEAATTLQHFAGDGPHRLGQRANVWWSSPVRRPSVEETAR